MLPSDTPKGRLLRLGLLAAGLLAAGLAYAGIASLLGFGIPCLFHTVTELQCPGCGVSRMCLSLLRGDIAAAWHWNAGVMCCLLPGAAVALDMVWQYVRRGVCRLHPWANGLCWVMLLWLVLFGILRNI